MDSNHVEKQEMADAALLLSPLEAWSVLHAALDGSDENQGAERFIRRLCAGRAQGKTIPQTLSDVVLELDGLTATSIHACIINLLSGREDGGEQPQGPCGGNLYQDSEIQILTHIIAPAFLCVRQLN